LRQHAFAVETRSGQIFARHVSGLDDLRRRRDARRVELGERIDVAEQVSELAPEDLDFLLG
jgi:hypothetical protein